MRRVMDRFCSSHCERAEPWSDIPLGRRFLVSDSGRERVLWSVDDCYHGFRWQWFDADGEKASKMLLLPFHDLLDPCLLYFVQVIRCCSPAKIVPFNTPAVREKRWLDHSNSRLVWYLICS